MPDELITTVKKTCVSVLLDTVNIEIVCGDGYEAQVLFEDLVERLQRGKTISITCPPSR
jgi:hypothetical protein